MKKGLVALTTGMMLSLTAFGLAPQVNAKATEDKQGFYDYTLAVLIDALNSDLTDKEFEDMGYSPDYKGTIKVYGEDGLKKIGYAYKDVTGDGVPELFIGEIETGAVYDIYTVINNLPAHVTSGGETDRYYVYDNGNICNECSSGPVESTMRVYSLDKNSTKMTFRFGYMYDEVRDEKNPWFTSDDDINWTKIKESEYKEAVKLSKSHRKLNFKPLDDIAPIDFSKVDISKYSTFTQIVNDLKTGMGYANVNLDGTDVLLVATGCYDWDGISAAIDSYVFMYGEDGTVVYLGTLQSGGTANPLVVYDGKLITATHHTVAKNTVKNGKLVVVEEASETFDTNGNATYYVGSKKVDDDTKLTEMFKEAMDAEIIDFQVVN